MSTTLGSDRDRQVVATTSAELDQAQQFVRDLATNSLLPLSVALEEEVVALPPELSALVAQILKIVAEGGNVTVGSMPAELTTSTAAKQLGVSRPTLMKMIERGDIPAHRVGTHTRLRTADVAAFRRERQLRRRAAFESLQALEDELD